MFLYLALGAILVAYYFVKRTFSYWERHGVPGVSGIFLFGSMWEAFTMKKHMGLLAQEWYKKYSNLPYFSYYKCSNPVLMIRDVELVKDVLVKNFNSFNINDIEIDEKVDPLLSLNPFMVSGEKWKHSRGILSPIFTNTKVKNIFPLMLNTCDKLVKYLDEHTDECLESRDLAAKFTTENSIMCGFSVNAESFTNPKAEFREFGRKLFDTDTSTAIKFTVMMFIPWLGKLMHVNFLPTDMDVWFRKFVKSNLALRKGVQKTDDFLQMLLNGSENKKLSDLEVMGHSLSFYSEGFETSSEVLSHAMFELSRNVQAQQKLYDEITTVLADFNGELNFDALNKMDYLEAVITETLRLYPILLVMQKKCSETYEFKPLPGQKKGYTMNKGGLISIPVHAIHRDAEYFPDPDSFDPERFMPEQRQNIPKGAYLGFGDGPRMCIGMRFGQTQVKAALATIVQKFEIKLSPETKPYQIDPKFFMNASIDPLLLNFVRRT